MSISSTIVRFLSLKYNSEGYVMPTYKKIKMRFIKDFLEGKKELFTPEQGYRAECA